MKMRILSAIPLMLLVGCGPKGTPPASPVNNTTMVTSPTVTGCTLTIQKGGKVINNPAEADIRGAVEALDDSEVGPRLLISLNGGAGQIELSGTPRYGFAFDYREGPAKDGATIYASKKTDYPAETAVKVLVAYRNGAPDWKTMVEWDKLKM